MLGHEHDRFKYRRAQWSLHCGTGPGACRTIAKHGWSPNDIKSYLWCIQATALTDRARPPLRQGLQSESSEVVQARRIAASRSYHPENIHLFVIGGNAGRFSAFIPGWGHMNTPVLKTITEATRS